MAPIDDCNNEPAVKNPSGHSLVDVGAIVSEGPSKQEELLEPRVKVSESHENNFCRFCWETENSIDNPLIKSCLCSGGVKFIHFHCLQ